MQSYQHADPCTRLMQSYHVKNTWSHNPCSHGGGRLVKNAWSRNPCMRGVQVSAC